jgi:hypothetical protein
MTTTNIASSLVISTLLESVPPPYCDTWSDLFDYLHEDPYESQVVALLAEALTTNGQFRLPIVVKDGEFMNGAHRLCAALDAGATTIVAVDHLPDLGDMLHLTFAVSAVPDELIDALYGAIRSFPLGDIWVETDCLATGSGELTATWYCKKEHTEELTTALVARMAAIGVTAQLVTVELR